MKNTSKNYIKLHRKMNHHKSRLLTLFVTIYIVSAFAVSGCTPSGVSQTVTDYKLNTYVSITDYSGADVHKLKEFFSICDEYERLFSRTLSSSTLYKVNNHEITQIPEELGELIEYGIEYSRLSNGNFDITIGSVSQLWDFTSDVTEHKVPDTQAISEALTHVDYTKIKLEKQPDSSYIIDIPEGTIIDLGAIAKGYIADRMKDKLLENGINSAIINLGGNVLCIGSKSADKPFNIGVKKPFTTTNEVLLSLNLNDMSAVSSGTYERYFYDTDNNFYHHILNPHTGYPYSNGLTDVTIISKESVTGDCLSTTCFVLGLDEGMKLIESLDGIEAVFVTDDGNLHYSSGFNAYLNN